MGWDETSNIVTDDMKEEKQEHKKNSKHKPKLSNEDILKMFHSNNEGTYNMSNVMGNGSTMSNILGRTPISDLNNISKMRNMKGQNAIGDISDKQNMNNAIDRSISIS